MYNEDIQLCILIYDNRINTYRRMQMIDKTLDECPDLAIEMVECDIMNKKAHEELVHYENTRSFLYIHPLTINKRDTSQTLKELRTLKRESPDDFLKEIHNVEQNIKRIKSNIATGKAKNDETEKNWKDNLFRAQTYRELIKRVMSE